MSSGSVEEESFMRCQPIVAGERRLVGWGFAFGSRHDGRAISDGESNSAEYLAAMREFALTANWDALLCGARA